MYELELEVEAAIMRSEMRHIQHGIDDGWVWQSSYYGKLAAAYQASGMLAERVR